MSAVVEPLAPRLWTPEMVCAAFPGLTIRKLRDLRGAGLPPAFFKPTERTVMYDTEEVIAWVEKSRVTPARA